MKRKISILFLAVTLTLSFDSASAGSASAGWQAIQNGQLVASVAKQSQMVSQQVKDYSNQLMQYQTMLTNLKQYDPAQLARNLEGVKRNLESAKRIYSATQDLNSKYRNAQEIYERRNSEIKKLKLSSEEYFNNEYDLAEAKGGIYKAQLDSDMRELEEAERKSAEFQMMSSDINNISGNVKGLSLLAQQNQYMLGELSNLNIHLKKQSVEKHQKNAMDNDQKQKDIKREKELEAQIINDMSIQSKAMKDAKEGLKKNVY